jgi:DNA-binding SARP family transcriptional activator
MHSDSVITIRMLGPWSVVRSDGSLVDAAEWRTGKTKDLLRILALGNGSPVRPASILDRLWPNVSPERGGASLRTASSQIRRALRENCVVRGPEGLVLRPAWVDVTSFLDDARRAAVAAREGDHARVVSSAQRALALYADDFHAHDDLADWAIAQREHLVQARLNLLCEAASSAQAMHRFREAADWAAAAVEIDPTSETAHRVLMAAQAGRGDIASALRIFEAYRLRIAEELGADPSPQTRDLHLRLLRGNSA